MPSPGSLLQFADGVYLVLLMGLLEDYFVPLHNFYLTPDSFDQKVRVCAVSILGMVWDTRIQVSSVESPGHSL